MVTYGQIVLKIDLGRCLCGYIQRTRADSGCCQAEEGMARPGNSAESPSTAALRRTAYAGYGSAAACRAATRMRWPRAMADYQPPGVLTTRPGRAIRAKRTAFRLLTHAASVEFSRHRPPCCVGTEQPRRKPAPVQVILDNAVDLLALATSMPRPPDQLISRNGWSPLQTPYANPCRTTPWQQRATPSAPPSQAAAVRSTAP